MQRLVPVEQLNDCNTVERQGKKVKGRVDDDGLVRLVVGGMRGKS